MRYHYVEDHVRGHAVTWDGISLVVLAAFGLVTLLLTQISDVLSRLPQIIRAWRRVQHELRAKSDADPGGGTVAPTRGAHAQGKSGARQDES
ncbi:hypothetical protein [Streptomyces sp. NPDC049879]|uniref:hypothetical protein n=1 Tax=Streptomyces sp. NPDC049879 TaxID=3365598 RepID=UPI0037A857D1